MIEIQRVEQEAINEIRNFLNNESDYVSMLEDLSDAKSDVFTYIEKVDKSLFRVLNCQADLLKLMKPFAVLEGQINIMNYGKRLLRTLT